MSEKQTKVIIFGVDWLGDTVFAVPAIRNLKEKFPAGTIDYVLPGHLAPVALTSDCINKIIPFDEKPFLIGLFHWIKLIQQLRKQKYDIALFFHRSFTRSLAAFFSGIPRRIGHQHSKRDKLMTQVVPAPAISEHRIESYNRVVEEVGAKKDDLQVRLSLNSLSSKTFLKLSRQFSIKENSYVVIHPGANWNLKRWPAEYFSKVLKGLKQSGELVVFCGSQKDFDLSNQIIETADVAAINLCGKTDLESLIFLIAHAKLVVSNDSGPLHLASGFNRPFIALFGPTSPQSTRPNQTADSFIFFNRIGCEIPCYFKSCHDLRCLHSIRPELVLKKCSQLLGKIG